MIAAPPPEVTEIAAFQPRRDGQRLVEARVLAQMDLEATTRLIKKTNGITTSEEVMFVLLASDAGAETRRARAVMLVDPDDEDRFREWLLARAVGFGARGPLVMVEGVVSQSGSSLTAEALEDRGYDRGGPDFYITPFLDGRVAGLQATARERAVLIWGIFALAGVFVLIAAAKLRPWAKRRGAAKPVGMAGQVTAGQVTVGQVTVGPTPGHAAHAAPGGAGAGRGDDPRIRCR